MNINDRAEELYKSGKVLELMEYLMEIMGETSVSFSQHGLLYDVDKYNHEEIHNLSTLGLSADNKDCFDGFNLINVTILNKREEFTLRTEKLVYTIFQIEDGSWKMTGMVDRSMNDNNSRFKSMTFDSIVSFFTDLSFKITEDFTYIEQVANSELIDVYSEYLESLKMIFEFFTPKEGELSNTEPFYSRYKIHLKPLKPIFQELGINIEKIKDEEIFSDDIVKKILLTSKNLNCFKFHTVEFDYNGIRYELYKDYGTTDGFILTYSNVIEEISKYDVLERLHLIYADKIGVELFNAIFDDINNEFPDFVSGYMKSFTKFTEFMEDIVSYKNGIGLEDLVPETLEFLKCSMTMLSSTMSHDDLLDIINGDGTNSSDVMRFCHSEYRKYKAWFDLNLTIHLQNTETFEILKFENLEKFDQHLEKTYNKKLKTVKNENNSNTRAERGFSKH